MGSILSYKHGKGSVDGVDPRLWDIVQNAIAVSPYDAIIRSGAEKRSTNGGNHNPGFAVDVTLVDPKTGEKIPDYQNGKSFATYEQFAQAARVYQQANYPELGKDFRWGGYFGSSKGTSGYGAVDLMHLDINPKMRGDTSLGNWETGASQRLLNAYPGATTNGGLSGTNGSRLVAQYENAFTNKGKYAPPAGMGADAPLPMPGRPSAMGGSTAIAAIDAATGMGQGISDTALSALMAWGGVEQPSAPLPNPPGGAFPDAAMYGVRRVPGAPAPDKPEGYDPYGEKNDMGAVDERMMSMLGPRLTLPPAPRSVPAPSLDETRAEQLQGRQRLPLQRGSGSLPTPAGAPPAPPNVSRQPPALPSPAAFNLAPVKAPTRAETMAEQNKARPVPGPKPAAAAPQLTPQQKAAIADVPPTARAGAVTAAAAPTTKTVPNPAYAEWAKKYGTVTAPTMAETRAEQAMMRGARPTAPAAPPPPPAKTITVKLPPAPPAPPAPSGGFNLGNALGGLGTNIMGGLNSAVETVKGGVSSAQAALPGMQDAIIAEAIKSPKIRGAVIDPIVAGLFTKTPMSTSPTRYGETFADRQLAAQNRERLSRGLPPLPGTPGGAAVRAPAPLPVSAPAPARLGAPPVPPIPMLRPLALSAPPANTLMDAITALPGGLLTAAPAIVKAMQDPVNATISGRTASIEPGVRKLLTGSVKPPPPPGKPAGYGEKGYSVNSARAGMPWAF
jgi:hypothetical protein